jgi:hypothetical protein
VSAVPEYLRLCISAALLLATLSVIASGASGTEIPAAEKRSDYEFMSPETRAIQDDDTVNPGMFSVLDGEGLWSRKDGAPNVSCADCHTTESLRGLAARYPTFAPDYKRPVDLEERINICHARRQNATPFRFDSRELLALTAFVAHQSRGVPIQVTIDERLKPFFDAGRERHQVALTLAGPVVLTPWRTCRSFAVSEIMLAILDLKLCAENAPQRTAHHSALATRGIARFSGSHWKKCTVMSCVCCG